MTAVMRFAVYYCILGLILTDVTSSDDQCSQDVAAHHSGGDCGESVVSIPPEWDDKGYTMFCPCMGNFGNQVEYLLGTLAFAKTIDRTMVIPPFRIKENVPFSTWFKVEPLKDFHRVITMEEFLHYFGADRWPPGQRTGYCRISPTSNHTCDMKRGNPLELFWSDLDVEFDDTVKYSLFVHADVADEEGVDKMRKSWNDTFPSSEYPVVVHRFPPAPYPMRAGNRYIQRYLQWNTKTLGLAEEVIARLFHGERYVGIHLRTGPDWVSACAKTIGAAHVMASSQCLSQGETVFIEMCYPPAEYIVNHTRDAVLKYDVQNVYIATDKLSYSKELKEGLAPIGVKVHHLDPKLPQLDLMVLGQSDFFIGNCVSSFTSFVKRERDASGKPSTFWGYPV